jgi:2-amino-4-hydroxy-6-hydroxymethyldihydropteridine diphosphokinase
MISNVVIGVGGNIGTDAELVERYRRARESIARLGDVRSAPLYRTAAIGPDQQPFLNTAVKLATEHVQPAELIATLLEIERLLGRDRRGEARNGPRALDLDVLLWEYRVIRSVELEVPHPRLAGRRFALEPLIALVGEAFEIPGLGPAGALLDRVRDQAVEQIAATW